MRVFDELNIKSKLTLIIVVVSLGAVLTVGYLNWRFTRTTLTQTISNQLTSVRASKAAQIETYFENIRHQVETLCQDDMIVAAMVRFKKAFRKLNLQQISGEWQEEIERYYNDVFFPKLFAHLEGAPNLELYTPDSQAALYLQYRYIVANLHSLDAKGEFSDAADGSEYNKFHKKYHPILRQWVTKFGYKDMFLVDIRNGDIVYTVDKGVDFATNLDTGPYRASNLAEVVAEVRRHPDLGAVRIMDFASYKPSYGASTAFIAGPI
ncbi:hypothetical protein [Candidatus Entotheonella palauensis]|uniref:hypothetical protein n=1 Tax=Candidatus Entotheonella palauensis TaxID=93172 RepID=UPI000B7CADF7|nr:hypothetical protein [Candidatus Entotheonella palauensis]